MHTSNYVRTCSISLGMGIILLLSGCGKMPYHAKKLIPLTSQTASYHKQQGPIQLLAKKLTSEEIEYYFECKKRLKKEFPYKVVHISITNSSSIPYTLLTKSITPEPLTYKRVQAALGFKFLTANGPEYVLIATGILAGSLLLGVGFIPLVAGTALHNQAITLIGGSLVGVGSATIGLSLISGILYGQNISSINKCIKQDILEKTIDTMQILRPAKKIDKLLFWDAKTYSSSISLSITSEESGASQFVISLPQDVENESNLHKTI